MKYQATESMGDTLTGDIVLSADQRKIAGRVQNLQLAYERKQEEFADAIKQLKDAEASLKRAKDDLYEAMSEGDIKTIESDILKITVVEPTTVKTVDSKAIQARDPRMWKKIEESYLKTTNRKGYVKITDKRDRQTALQIEG